MFLSLPPTQWWKVILSSVSVAVGFYLTVFFDLPRFIGSPSPLFSRFQCCGSRNFSKVFCTESPLRVSPHIKPPCYWFHARIAVSGGFFPLPPFCPYYGGLLAFRSRFVFHSKTCPVQVFSKRANVLLVPICLCNFACGHVTEPVFWSVFSRYWRPETSVFLPEMPFNTMFSLFFVRRLPFFCFVFLIF